MSSAKRDSKKMGEKAANSSSSSIDSSSTYPPPSSSSCPAKNDNGDTDTSTRRHLGTDLRLGLSISSPSKDVSSSSTHREQKLDWPPIKPHLRSTLTKKPDSRRQRQQQPSLFVKVYMEGIPIGRKLNLLTHDGYPALISSLTHMFKATILCTDADHLHSGKHHVLTYEDKEGDWMMVGDVPWELFLITVKRLKITRADRC